jgi:hypothetical protein
MRKDMLKEEAVFVNLAIEKSKELLSRDNVIRKW